MGCPPCKIILDDGGIVIAAADALVELHRFDDSRPARRLAASAVLLSRTARGVVESLVHAIRTGVIPPVSPDMDKAHALSELACHRAKTIRGWIEKDLPIGKNAAALLAKWAEEMRLETTALLGGEYRGAWEVIGDERIAKKE